MLFRHIAFPDDTDSVESEFRIDDEGELSLLSDLAHINILVGGNNSGKSRILRILAAKAFWGIQEPNESLNRAINKCSPNGEYFRRWTDTWPRILNQARDEKGTPYERKFLKHLAEHCSKNKPTGSDTFAEAFRSHLSSTGLSGYSVGNNRFTKEILDEMVNLIDRDGNSSNIPNLPKKITIGPNLRTVYIPTLRTLRPIIQRDQFLDGLGETRGTRSRETLKSENVSISLEKRLERAS